MTKQYWALGLNFEYDVVTEQPNNSEYGSLKGPFKTLKEAKEQVKTWISSDRGNLAYELDKVNKLKARDFK